MRKALQIILIWIFVFFCLRGIYTKYKADVDYEKAVTVNYVNDYSVNIYLSDLSIKQNPFEPNYYKGKAKVLLMSILYSDVSRHQVIKGAILDNCRKALELNPDNLVTARNLVPIYYYLAVNNLSTDVSDAGIDEDYIKITLDYFNFIKTKYKNDAGVITLVAKYEKRLGDSTGYAQSVEDIKRLRPDLLQWHESFR